MADHRATNVAYRFLQLASVDDMSLTPMQLQKLVYIAHGWSLGLFDDPLVSDDVSAWKFGPVIEPLYQHFKEFRASPVRIPPQIVNGYVCSAGFDDRDETVISAVWQSYRGLTGPQLSDLTHQSDTPWDTVWNKREGYRYHGAVIDNPTIGAYYKTFLTSGNGN